MIPNVTPSVLQTVITRSRLIRTQHGLMRVDTVQTTIGNQVFTETKVTSASALDVAA